MDIDKLIKNKKIFYILIALVVGISLLIFSSTFSDDKSKGGNMLINETKRNTEQTATGLEKRLKEIISTMEGVSNVNVMVTMDESSNLILASNTETDGENQSENIMIGAGSGGKSPVVVREVEPKVRGVVVTAKGVDSQEKKYKVWQAVRAVTNVAAYRIEIQEGK